MCVNELCPNADSCYRIQATPSQWQSYAQYEYEMSSNGVICDNYIKYGLEHGNRSNGKD